MDFNIEKFNLLNNISLYYTPINSFDVSQSILVLNIIGCQLEQINFSKNFVLQSLNITNNKNLTLIEEFPQSLVQLTIIKISKHSPFQKYQNLINLQALTIQIDNKSIILPQQLLKLSIISSYNSSFNLNKNLFQLYIKNSGELYFYLPSHVNQLSIFQCDQLNFSSSFDFLQILDINNSRLIDFKRHLQNIERINCSNSSIIHLDIQNSIKLIELFFINCYRIVFKSNIISTNIQNITNIYITAKQCKFVNLNLKNCNELLSIDIEQSTEIEIDHCIIPEKVQYINANFTENMRLFILNCHNLEELLFDGASDITLDGIPKNIKLFTAKNSIISGINILQSDLLESINLYHCQLYRQREIQLNLLQSQLQYITIAFSKLQTCVVSLPSTLLFANFQNINIHEFNLTETMNLLILQCRNIPNLKFKENFLPLSIQSLELINCQIKILDLAFCLDLESLHIRQMTMILLHENFLPYSIKSLQIGNNCIQQINLTHLQNLIDLLIYQSQITISNGILPQKIQRIKLIQSTINIDLRSQQQPVQLILDIDSQITFSLNYLPYWFGEIISFHIVQKMYVLIVQHTCNAFFNAQAKLKKYQRFYILKLTKLLSNHITFEIFTNLNIFQLASFSFNIFQDIFSDSSSQESPNMNFILEKLTLLFFDYHNEHDFRNY